MLITLKLDWSVLKLCFMLMALSIFSTGFIKGQTKNELLMPLNVKKGSYVYLNDSVKYFAYDTLLYISSTLIPDNPENQARTKGFYDSLKTKASRSGFGRRLYDIAIVLPPEKSTQDIQVRVNHNYEEHAGKKIRRISFTRLDPFGTNIYNPDTSSVTGFAKFLNKTRFTTRELTLKSYIFFSEGDIVNAYSLSESERILRRLKFIDDARIVVVPVSNQMVDIIVITKDIYTIGFDYEIRGLKSGTLELFEQSMFGLGHNLVIDFPYDYYKDYYGFGWGVSYNINNIRRSFINSKLEYSNSLGKEFYGIDINRPFVSTKTKYGGGVQIRETYTSNDLDTLSERVPVEYNYIDAWFGRSLMIDSANLTRLVISARYINNNVYERPEISSDSYYYLQKYKLYLASASLISQKYYKTNLLYNFGRTEDIPYGGKLDITYGREFNEFARREYVSLQAAMGGLAGRLGYFYASAKIGAYSNDFITEQGVVDLRLNYISNLISSGRYRFRHFVNARFTNGFYRFSNEYLRIDNNYGIRGYDNDTIRPEQRLILNLESVAFSPNYIYGFRFAWFGFSDIAVISNDKAMGMKTSVVAEIGMGVRIRNENLIFKTIQFRFSIFPFSPPYSKFTYFDVTGEKLLRPPNFDPVAPQIISYR